MQQLNIQPRENIIAIDGWDEYLRDGHQFLNVATGAHKRKSRSFNPEALYNLVAMAIEKFIMAFLMKNGDLAENHTMTDLANALERHLGENLELKEKLIFLDTFQDICDLDEAKYIRPNEEQISQIIRIGHEIETLITAHLSPS